MDKKVRIYVAGHTGLVGSALVRSLHRHGYTNIITQSHVDLDLKDSSRVDSFFAAKNPEYVFLAAAKVGGIHANSTYPVDFLLTNLRIQNNVIESAWRHNVKGFVFLGSSCIYPKLAPQPLKEEYLLTGPLEPTNEPYAIAKIAGIELCEAFNKQYGTRFLSVMPTNLFGPGDSYDLNKSHVLPAFIRKFHLAKLASDGDWQGIIKDERIYGAIPQDIIGSLVAIAKASGYEIEQKIRELRGNHIPAAVCLWGSGTPRREFLYSDDLADGCVYLLEHINDIFARSQAAKIKDTASCHLINIGWGRDITILELATMISKIIGYSGKIHWDHTKPDGTPQKLLDIAKITGLGWQPKVPLKDGIKMAYEDYLKRGE